MNDDTLEELFDLDIFAQDGVGYGVLHEEAGMSLAFGGIKDTEVGRITTLSEVFLEWYLFDSSKEKDVKTFLADEGIQDIFTEQDFMDLMCGGAYLDKYLLQFVILKLPFYIKPNRIQYLNTHALHKNPNARMINPPQDLPEKIQAQIQKIKKAKQDKQSEYAKKNRAKINARKRKHWAQNKDKINQKRREYYAQNREKMLAQKHQWYHSHLEFMHAYDKKRRTRDKAKRAECQKRSVSKKPEHYKQYKHTWYEANKVAQKEQDQQRRLKYKEQAESAQGVCVAFLFLLNLRKTNMKKYLELYTYQQKPLIHMLKTCPALQSMDINLCPFCNSDSGQKVEECCNQKVLALPNAINELQIIANNLRQR